MKCIHLVPQHHGLFYIDINFLLLEITYWILLAVTYSWSFDSNKYEYQDAEYIFPSEIVLGQTTSLLTISPFYRQFSISLLQCLRKDNFSRCKNYFTTETHQL